MPGANIAQLEVVQESRARVESVLEEVGGTRAETAAAGEGNGREIQAVEARKEKERNG